MHLPLPARFRIAGLAFALAACTPSASPPEPPPTPPATLISAQAALDALRAARAGVHEAEHAGWTAALTHLTERELAGPAAARAPDARHVRLLVGSNIRAELEDCGCPRNPLGGLARRATLYDDGAEDGVPHFHLDAGDALVQRAPLLDGQRAVPIARAQGVAAALVAMHIDAIAAGPHELALAPDDLRPLVANARLPMISANVQAADALAFPPSLLIERDAFRLSVVGVHAGDAPDDGAWTLAHPVDTATAAIRAAREDDAHLVVLLGAGGMGRIETLLAALRLNDALPDLVAVSGSARMMRGPLFVEGVPVVETGDRGKHLMWLDLHLAPNDDGPLVFLSPESSGQAEVRRWSTAARALRATERTLALLDEDDAEERNAQEHILEAQREREAALRVDARASVRAPRAREGVNASTIEARLVDVVLTIEERHDVKTLVDRTRAAMRDAAGDALR